MRTCSAAQELAPLARFRLFARFERARQLDGFEAKSFAQLIGSFENLIEFLALRGFEQVALEHSALEIRGADAHQTHFPLRIVIALQETEYTIKNDGIEVGWLVDGDVA